MRDTAAVLDAVSGPAPGDPYAAPTPARPFVEEVGADPGRLRIGVQHVAFGATVATHPDCVDAADEAGALLESLGHMVEPTHVAALDSPDFVEAFLLVWSAGVGYDVEHYWSAKLGRAIRQDEVEPLTWALVEAARAASAADFLDARQKLQAVSRQVGEWYEDGFDLLLTPTLAEPPPLLGEFDSPADNPVHGLLRAAALVPFTPPFNVSGQPAISLPLHWNGDGLPIGVQLVAPLRARGRPSPGGRPARRGGAVGASPSRR